MLLDTALGMLHEVGPSAGVGHIHIKDVVARAGLTVGAAYPHWRTQETFRQDLAIAAVRWRDRESIKKTFDRIGDVFAAGGPLNEVLRLGSEGNLQSFPDDAPFLTTLALRASAIGHPELIDASHSRHKESMAAFSELYATVLSSYGLKMRKPFTLEHLSSVFAALMEGFALQTLTGEDHPRVNLGPSDPELSGEDSVGSDWTLLAISVVAVARRMTEPIH